MTLSKRHLPKFLVAATALLFHPSQTTTSHSDASAIAALSAASLSFHQPLVQPPAAIAPLKRMDQYCYKDKFAFIATDAVSGDEIFGCNEDELRSPASLTKMMTLFITFQELRNGNLKRDQRLNIARESYQTDDELQILDVKPGYRLTVDQAIATAAIYSACDATDVLAENISGSVKENISSNVERSVAGSVERFAERMNECAAELGMTKTHFTNASGAPDKRQVTTARDMAKLMRALQQYFPEECKVFLLQSVTYGGKILHNHANIPGADMSKTGKTDDAANCVASSFPYAEGRVNAVIMGAVSSPKRRKYMVELSKTAIDIVRNDTTGRYIHPAMQTEHFRNFPLPRDPFELHTNKKIEPIKFQPRLPNPTDTVFARRLNTVRKLP